jgi:hypothetical protein
MREFPEHIQVGVLGKHTGNGGVHFRCQSHQEEVGSSGHGTGDTKRKQLRAVVSCDHAGPSHPGVLGEPDG